MNARLLSALLCLLLVPRGFAAEAPDAKTSPDPKSKMREILRARGAEQAKKNAANPMPPLAAPGAEPGNVASTPPAASKDAKTSPDQSAAKQEPATVLPKVEVRRERITELDQQIAKQQHDIAREKQNTKSSEMDRALNDSKIAKKLSVFGGESADYRANLAKERVSLMEAEKDILEAMKLSRTAAEKKELQKQLDELRALRRDLERSLR